MLQDLGRKVRARAEAVLERGAEKSAGVRVLRDVIGGIDELLGQPFAEKVAPAAAAEAPKPREAAPVIVYFDGKDHRTLRRIDGVLVGANVPYKTLDVGEDEAARSWAMAKAGKQELPLVFVAGEAIGGFDELLQASVDGSLAKKVFV